MPSRSSPPAERLADVLGEVRRVELRASRLMTDVLSGGYRSTFRGLGVEFSEVREYVEGDDPRSVDWNVTARVGRPFVKRFVEERERTLVFVLDLGRSMDLGCGAWSSRQVAARYCAMLGLLAIDNHDRVGLVAGGDDGVERFVLPQPGGGHVLRVLADCVQLPTRGGSGLDRLLAKVSARIRRRAVVFVLSDFSTPGYEHALSLCARHHDVVAVRVWPREWFAPPRLLVRCALPGVGERSVDFRSAAVREPWLAHCRALRAAHADLLGRAGADGIDVETPFEPDVRELARPLQQFFRRRGKREARR